MRVSVRNVGYNSEIAKALKEGRSVLPEECRHNTDLLENLLKEMYRVDPNFGKLDATTIRLVAEGVAYTLRPDLLGKTRKVRGVERTPIRTKPDSLCEDFIFPPHHSNQDETYTAMEFFRCLSVPYAYLPAFKETVEFGKLVNVADAMSRLVDTSFFTSYKYDQAAIDDYENDIDDI